MSETNFSLRAVVVMALIACYGISSADETKTWSEVLDASYPMGSDTTMGEAMTQLREDLRSRAVARAGEYVAGRTSLNGDQLSKHLDRITGGTVKLEVLERDVMMRQGYPVLQVSARVSVDERDVVRFLNHNPRKRPSIRGQVASIDRSNSMPAANVLDSELKALREQADQVSRQLRRNFAARVFLEPKLSVDANKARFKVRVLWQTAAPALLEMDLIEPYLVRAQTFDYAEYSRRRYEEQWPVALKPGAHRWHADKFGGPIWDDYMSTILEADARDQVPRPDWEKLDIELKAIQENTPASLLRQAALLVLAHDQLDVVLQIGNREYRHPVVSGYCANDERVHDWMEAVDAPREDQSYPEGLLEPGELRLRDKEAFNNWNESCRPNVAVRFTPSSFDISERGDWDELRDPDHREGSPFDDNGRGIASPRWSKQMESPNEAFPGLAWEFTVTLDSNEDPDAVSVYLESRHL